jgi:hypothetical protein
VFRTLRSAQYISACGLALITACVLDLGETALVAVTSVIFML